MRRGKKMMIMLMAVWGIGQIAFADSGAGSVTVPTVTPAPPAQPVVQDRFPRPNLNNTPKSPRQFPYNRPLTPPPSYLTKPVPHTIRSTYQPSTVVPPAPPAVLPPKN